jgi:AcrR family transcriptional regulator
MVESSTEKVDRQRQRRDRRREANRSEILDAAELVASRVGVHNASMRLIAAEAGFSTAGLYLFFENRNQLFAEMLARHGDELNKFFAETIATASEPLEALHAIIDSTLDFYTEHAETWRLWNQLRIGTSLVPEGADPDLVDYTAEFMSRYAASEQILADLFMSGQEHGTMRRGDPHVLVRLYIVLVNEFIRLNLEDDLELRAPEFHAIIDDAFSHRA